MTPIHAVIVGAGQAGLATSHGLASHGVEDATVSQPGWLSRAVLAGATWIRWRAERRRAVAQLHAMSDWQLNDIGLTRADIHAAVAGRLERRV